jgi:hypothetical protein
MPVLSICKPPSTKSVLSTLNSATHKPAQASATSPCLVSRRQGRPRYWIHSKSEHVSCTRVTTSGNTAWEILHRWVWGPNKQKPNSPWPRSATELYRPSDCHLSAKLADSGCQAVSVTDPYGSILDFLDRSRYLFFQVAPQLYSRGWVDPRFRPTTSQKIWKRRESNPDLWICNTEHWPLDHRGGPNSSEYTY